MTTLPVGSIAVAPSVRWGCAAKTDGHRLALGVLVVAEPVDPLVAGGAAVVAGDVLEVVVDRQVGQADLLDLGRRGGHVDPGEAPEPGEQAEVLRLLLLDQPLARARRRASAAPSPSRGRRCGRAGRPSSPRPRRISASTFSNSSVKAMELPLARDDRRVEVGPRLRPPRCGRSSRRRGCAGCRARPSGTASRCRAASNRPPISRSSLSTARISLAFSSASRLGGLDLGVDRLELGLRLRPPAPSASRPPRP